MTWENEWQVFKSGFINLRGLTLCYVICTTWSHLSIIPYPIEEIFLCNFIVYFINQIWKYFFSPINQLRRTSFILEKKNLFRWSINYTGFFRLALLLLMVIPEFLIRQICRSLPTLILICSYIVHAFGIRGNLNLTNAMVHWFLGWISLYIMESLL